MREQLARQVAAIRAGTTPTARMVYHGRPLRIWEVTLECRCDTPHMSVRYGIQARVNAAEIGGAAAGHLLLTGSRILVEYPNGLPSYRLTLRLQYADRPWNPPGLTPCPYLTANFDALLAALEPAATVPDAPPEREKTWRELPGLL